MKLTRAQRRALRSAEAFGGLVRPRGAGRWRPAIASLFGVERFAERTVSKLVEIGVAVRVDLPSGASVVRARCAYGQEAQS